MEPTPLQPTGIIYIALYDDSIHVLQVVVVLSFTWLNF